MASIDNIVALMAWSLTHAKLHTQLRKRILLPKNSHILMAVSGGQDSLCLAQLLVDLQPKWNWTLGVVHCNHRWRQDAKANAHHVEQLAKDWGIPAWTTVANVPPASEAEARKWRYESFATIARAQGYPIVVTGHTLSDRAETILYNLIRGTGIDGIGTLPWQRTLDQNSPAIALVRPLLDFSREQTGQFCQQYPLPVWEDSTNDDLTFRRNRIRQELLPYLQTHFNPRVEQALTRLGDMSAADAQYLQAQTQQLYPKVIAANTDRSAWEIHCSQLCKQPLALQRRVIRQLLTEVLPKPPTFQHVEKIIDLLSAPNGSQTEPYTGGIVAQVRRHDPTFQRLSEVEHAIEQSAKQPNNRALTNDESNSESPVIWIGRITATSI